MIANLPGPKTMDISASLLVAAEMASVQALLSSLQDCERLMHACGVKSVGTVSDE